MLRKYVRTNYGIRELQAFFSESFCICTFTLTLAKIISLVQFENIKKIRHQCDLNSIPSSSEASTKKGTIKLLAVSILKTKPLQ